MSVVARENVELNPDQLIAKVADLARGKFAPRAPQYDQETKFPAENFADLVAAGLNAPAIPQRYGGLGLGPDNNLFTLWMMTKSFASADLSFARCWEGHVNSQMLLTHLADAEQQLRWFQGIVDQGHIWVAWSGEPQSVPAGSQSRFGTHVTETNDGFIVDGCKVFASGAGSADWAILLVNTEGPGGARHAKGSPESLLLLACDLSDSSVSYDSSWWDPIGMRGTVSHLVRFDQTFIPKQNLIGYPGQYLLEGWQSRFTPHYAATFLGAAEAAFDYAVDNLKSHGKANDPFVQQHIAQMAIKTETAHLWLQNVANLWEAGDEANAKLAGLRARYLIEHLAQETVDHCIRSCGARCLIRPSPIERILRDLTFYSRHDNADHLLAAIGQEVLGLSADLSFFKQVPDKNPSATES